MYQDSHLDFLVLGKKNTYTSYYSPELLQGVPRSLNRSQLGIETHLPFNTGADLWTAFELSWLNEKGVPQVAIAEISLDFRSENLVESKSFKLYLNSLNQTKFNSVYAVQACLERDLKHCARGEVQVEIKPLHTFQNRLITSLAGENIDNQDIRIESYTFDAGLLEDCSKNGEWVEETLVSDLLKSNCLITQQPDWGSVQIHYVGQKINREKLLRYLISFREHNEFHEQCVERIYCDLLRYAKMEKLTVYARYTRRGGLDINPFRSNFESVPRGIRLPRQ